MHDPLSRENRSPRSTKSSWYTNESLEFKSRLKKKKKINTLSTTNCHLKGDAAQLHLKAVSFTHMRTRSTTKGCDLDADCLLNTYLTSIAQVSAPRGHNILLLGWTWNYFYIVQALEMDFPFPCLYFPLTEAGYPPWFEPLCWLSLRSWAMLGPVHVDTWSISTCVGYVCFFFFFLTLGFFL